MVPGKKQVVKLDMVYLVSFKSSCHPGFSAPRMAENETYIGIARIEAFLLVVKIRFRMHIFFIRQLQIFKDVGFSDQFISYKDIHFRYVMT